MAPKAKKSLVIVESPSKARTIERYLGGDFQVLSSVGHVRDLPSSKLGVDVKNRFEPTYEIIRGKAKVIEQLKKAAGACKQVFLATDPDREGEAIAWHIAQEIEKANSHISRVTFNEITAGAVREAIEGPKELDLDLVNAQQARRVLDRLVGYQISPILWTKFQKGLSAGRVQSVAVRLICERELAILAFVAKEYWSIEAEVEKPGEKPPFTMKLAAIDGDSKFEIPNEDLANAIVAAVEGEPFRVDKIARKQTQRRAAPPFITSTLQQEASRKLRFTAHRAMSVAQSLYEGIEIGQAGPTGLITYMRTDSTRVAKQAQDAARDYIAKRYGGEYCPKTPNAFPSKKGAQDAHEAIRPTSMELPPEAVEQFLSPEQLKLYTLVWNRFLASQMSPAKIDQTRVESRVTGGKYLFAATGSVVAFPGFLAVYEEGKDEKNGDEDGDEAKLPLLAEGDALKRKSLKGLQHFTQPPPRFTEATLVKELETLGIGRPSTYAAIIHTIQQREYVDKDKGRFKPTERGQIVTELLIANFPEILDVKFTAQMEDELDHVEEGQTDWVDLLSTFNTGFQVRLEAAGKNMRNVKREVVKTDLVCDKCGAEMIVRWGRNGRFLACSAYPNCKNAKPYETDEEGKIRPVEVQVQESGEKCDLCGAPMVVKTSKRGQFLGCSTYPKCKSIKKMDVGEGGVAVARPAPEPTGEACEKCGSPMVVKLGRRGKFVSCSGFPKCRNAKPYTPKEGEATEPAAPRKAPEPTGEACDKCGAPMVAKVGRRGPFAACSAYPKCKNAKPLKSDATKPEGDPDAPEA